MAVSTPAERHCRQRVRRAFPSPRTLRSMHSTPDERLRFTPSRPARPASRARSRPAPSPSAPSRPLACPTPHTSYPSARERAFRARCGTNIPPALPTPRAPADKLAAFARRCCLCEQAPRGAGAQAKSVSRSAYVLHRSTLYYKSRTLTQMHLVDSQGDNAP